MTTQQHDDMRASRGIGVWAIAVPLCVYAAIYFAFIH